MAVFLLIDYTYFILQVFHGILHDFFLPVPYWWPVHRSTSCKTFERDSFPQERFEMRKGRIGNTDRLYVQGMSTSKESKSIARTLSEKMAGFLTPFPFPALFAAFNPLSCTAPFQRHAFELIGQDTYLHMCKVRLRYQVSAMYCPA